MNKLNTIINPKQANRLAHQQQAIYASRENQGQAFNLTKPLWKVANTNAKNYKTVIKTDEQSLRQDIQDYLQKNNASYLNVFTQYIQKHSSEENIIIDVTRILYNQLRCNRDYDAAHIVAQIMKKNSVPGAQHELYKNSTDQDLHNEITKYWYNNKINPYYIEDDLCEMYATVLHHAKQARNFDDKKFLYTLLAKTGEDQDYVVIANMYIARYNQIVQNETTPSKDMLTALEGAQRYYSAIQMDAEDEIYHRYNDVCQKHYDIITFYINRPALSKHLTSKLKHFYFQAQADKKMVENLLRSSAYAQNESTEDLFHKLNANGFVLLYWQHNICLQTYQHIWVNREGMQIRIKPHAQQWTIGYTNINPMFCNDEKKVAKTINNVPVIDDNYNELFKLSGPYILPAFFKTTNQSTPQWDNSVSPEDQELVMKAAHPRIKKLSNANIQDSSAKASAFVVTEYGTRTIYGPFEKIHTQKTYSKRRGSP